MKTSILLAFVIMVLSQPSLARYKFFSEFGAKQAPKEQSRWTLADWLSSKEKVSLMDQWLAANRSANLTEFILGGSYSDFETETDPAGTTDEFSLVSGQLGFFVSIFGIQGRYFDRDDENLKVLEYSLAMRLLGFSQQTTNLSLHYGVRQSDYSETDQNYSQELVGAQLSINVFSGFGLQCEYSVFGEDEDSGNELSGNRLEYGAFLDFSFLRVFGNLWKEELTSDNGASEATQTSSGVDTGLKLFF